MPRGVYDRSKVKKSAEASPKETKAAKPAKAPKNGAVAKTIKPAPTPVCGVSIPDKFTILMGNLQTLAGMAVEFSKTNNTALVSKVMAEVNVNLDLLFQLREMVFGTPKSDAVVPQPVVNPPTLPIPANYPSAS